MVKAGLPVPPGAVLTTNFFAPWFDEIQASATWTALADATPDKWATLCNELMGLCPALPLTATQWQALTDLRKNLSALGDDMLFAVRSSSPEEDLASASFAGGYETRLGVRPADLADAVRHCFASSLDERVMSTRRRTASTFCRRASPWSCSSRSIARWPAWGSRSTRSRTTTTRLSLTPTGVWASRSSPGWCHPTTSSSTRSVGRLWTRSWAPSRSRSGWARTATPSSGGATVRRSLPSATPSSAS
ncbi:MAG TPA: hypothetical protein EYM31_04220 [Acidobacteria bacterium]|nr:hypothetical protein [Acidobacteriota bacterium]